MIKWTRPSGSILETNDNADIRAYARINGWQEIKEVVKNGNSRAGSEGVTPKNSGTSKRSANTSR